VNIFDVRENLDAIVFDHDQQIKDLAAQLLELKQLVTPMMEFKRREWVGLTDDDKTEIKKLVTYDQFETAGEYANRVQAATESKLKEKNGG